jgi:hypothetical protein
MGGPTAGNVALLIQHPSNLKARWWSADWESCEFSSTNLELVVTCTVLYLAGLGFPWFYYRKRQWARGIMMVVSN